ncbi:DMT family transporter [Planctomycetota bacterium]
MLASTVMFAVMSGLVRYVKDAGLDIYKVVLFRFAIGAVLLVSLAMFKIIKLEFKNSPFLFLRGLLGGIAVFLYFLSIYKIGLAKGTVISSSSPIFATIGGMLFLKERGSWRKWGLVILAFAGIVMISMGKGGDLSGFGRWELLAVTGALMAGGAYVVIKKLSITDSSYAIFMAQCAIGFWMVLIPANLKEASVGVTEGILLLLVGLSAAVGQLLMTWAFKHMNVSTGSLLGFISTVINMLIGIMVFEEEMFLLGILGSVLVIGACAAVVLVDKDPKIVPPRAR